MGTDREATKKPSRAHNDTATPSHSTSTDTSRPHCMSRTYRSQPTRRGDPHRSTSTRKATRPSKHDHDVSPRQYRKTVGPHYTDMEVLRVCVHARLMAYRVGA